MEVKFFADGKHKYLKIIDLNDPAAKWEGNAAEGLVTDIRTSNGVTGRVDIHTSMDGKAFSPHAANVSVQIGADVRVDSENPIVECLPGGARQEPRSGGDGTPKPQGT
jgi:hypothetical protein